LNDYIKILQLSDKAHDWVKAIQTCLTDCLTYMKWDLNNKQLLLEFLSEDKKKYDISTFRKRILQIRKFLKKNNVRWADSLEIPPEKKYSPKFIADEDINKTYDFFNGHRYKLQFHALIKLGSDTGARPGELYQLNPEDIDLKNQILYINHAPENGQTTKTKTSRVSFFTEETRKVLKEYLQCYRNSSELTRLFSKSHIEKQFKNAPIKVKQLRKYFSQEWDRRGGPTSIKKILMGHSLKGDIDLMHYNVQSHHDLKKIYEKIMEI
jgi:integrase/recombinase XerD